MDIKKQLFTCNRGGLLIRGAQYLPMDFCPDKRYPAIIVSHGFTGNYTDVEDFCKDFAKWGYAAFAFSFCGGSSPAEDCEKLSHVQATECQEQEAAAQTACAVHDGMTENVRSEGDTRDMTIWTEVEDLLAVKEYVQGLPYTDNGNLVLSGFSQGGFVSGLAAARCGEEIGKLIMVFPALCIPDHARRGCLGGACYDVRQVPDEIDCGNIVLGRVFHDTVAGMDPYLELSAYKGPVLILHGTEDRVVDVSYSVRAQANYEKGQCRLQLIRHMGHGFHEGQQKSAAASMRQFLDGRKEILAIRIVITRSETVEEGNIRKSDIYFTGYCDTEYFQGAVVPEGCDRQEYVEGVRTRIRAEYTLLGIDGSGVSCFIHIVNQWGGDQWRPVIKTDSHMLAWLNDAELTAVLEDGKGELTVRVFA